MRDISAFAAQSRLLVFSGPHRKHALSTGVLHADLKSTFNANVHRSWQMNRQGTSGRSNTFSSGLRPFFMESRLRRGLRKPASSTRG